MNLDKSKFLLLIVALLLANLSKGETSSRWQKQRWISKVAHTLSGGTSALEANEIESLANLSEDEIINILMAKKEFEYAVADFGLFYLGFKPESMKKSDRNFQSIADEAFSKPQVINAALAVSQNGDFKKALLEINQQSYLPKTMPPFVSIPENPEATDEKKFQWIIDKAKLSIDNAITAFGTPNNFNKEAGCMALFDDDYSNVFFTLGADNSFGLKMFWASLNHIIDFCYLDDVPNEDILEKASQLKDSLDSIHNMYLRSSSQEYLINSFSDLIPFTLDEIGFYDAKTRFTLDGFWLQLENSSTNANRRRAAYILKTYFCDNLTPLNVALPNDHAGDAHASDPACQSCHYKLDPMAGFFRYYGIRGKNFQNYKFITFDDNATFSDDAYDNYINSWKAKSTSSRKWNIGYIRSAKNENLNDYGESLADMVDIFNRAPEVNKCLVKKLAQYYIGPEQTFDRGWLDYLTGEFESQTNSTTGLKNVTAKILKSNAYKIDLAEPEKCYDYAPGRSPSSLPCGVAKIIEEHCVGCHDSTSGQNNLDLSRYEVNSLGELTFPHLEADGQTPVEKKATLNRMLERLSTKDDDLRMPQSSEMPATDRAELYLWIEKTLSLEIHQ